MTMTFGSTLGHCNKIFTLLISLFSTARVNSVRLKIIV